MRRTFTALHRWLGLFTAAFLFIAGFTGAIIAWDHELDGAINPHLYHSEGAGPVEPAQAMALATQFEAAHPTMHVRYLPLRTEEGHALQVFVGPTLDARTKQPHVLEHDQFALDPRTGDVQGKRLWGALSLAPEHILPFLYKLHYTLHLPDGFGIPLGTLFMGIVAILWTFDGFVALWLSFPSPKTWRKSFAFRFRAGFMKAVFDIHRSGGVWVFALLVVLSFTAVSMNLGEQVVRPLVGLFSPLGESAFAKGARLMEEGPEPSAPITREQAVLAAQKEASRRGLTAPVGGMFHAPEANLYGVGFFAPGLEHGDGGLGNPWIYVSARDGSLIEAEIPGEGTAGDIFMQAQFPLHSGRIFGTVGRAIISVMGLVVAALSATGIILWAKKRRARSSARERSTSEARAATAS